MMSAFLAIALAAAPAPAPTPTPAPAVRGRVIGIGGVFFKSDHHRETLAWYTKHLGLQSKPGMGVNFPWTSPLAPAVDGSTTWGVFPRKSTYYPGDMMINYVVDDLDALMARLAAEGVRLDPKREADEAGKFGWVYDVDGNKVELWQPAPAPTGAR